MFWSFFKGVDKKEHIIGSRNEMNIYCTFERFSIKLHCVVSLQYMYILSHNLLPMM
jgi:hypothetical protein